MEKSQNKMATSPINKLFWKMGLPMIISMVLQALYNVVDSVFVANMDGVGAIANRALTYAFPIQILIIAIGVGTGVGLNALLSKSLGFVFMDISISIQGILQSLNYALRPLIISLLRIVVFVFPIAYLFTLLDNVNSLVWWTFPIAEVLTAIIALFILKNSYDQKIRKI